MQKPSRPSVTKSANRFVEGGEDENNGKQERTGACYDLTLQTQLILKTAGNPTRFPTFSYGDIRCTLNLVPHIARCKGEDHHKTHCPPDDSGLDEWQ